MEKGERGREGTETGCREDGKMTKEEGAHRSTLSEKGKEKKKKCFSSLRST